MLHRKRNVRPPGATDHTSYEQLCALASSGALTTSEWALLSDHLKACGQCREELPEYQEIATFGMSLIAPTDPSLDVENEWSPESAVAKLMRRLQENGAKADPSIGHAATAGKNPRWWWPSGLLRMPAVLPYAAAIVVFAAVAVAIYVLGIHTGAGRSDPQTKLATQPDSMVAGLLRERGQLENDLRSRSSAIEAISKQLQDARVAVVAAEARKQVTDDKIHHLESRSQDQETQSAAIRSQYQALEGERLVIGEKLKVSEANLLAVQRSLDTLRDQHVADLTQIASLENQIASRQHEVPAAYVEARQVSSADPELSGLMGARDLFIADVYDIDKSGLPQKPFGRIFYTKGKSLLFYAFDLDRQPGVKPAATFQVWGRRGYGDAHPLNMGMMYLDSETSKRWALKFSDAKALSQVDAVFVTMEPHGGSNAPKGRQLLYASLRMPANHP
jgi:hypothetical protein